MSRPPVSTPIDISPSLDESRVDPDRDNVRGILWLTMSVVTASIMSLALRELTLTLDSRMVVFLRAAISCICLAIAFGLVARWRRALRFTSIRDHLLRGTLIAVSTHLGFYAIAQLPLAQATVLFFTAPIFATIMAHFAHGERAGPRRWMAIVMGFAGTCLILRPDLGVVSIPMLSAVVSSLFFAAALTLSRRLAAADGTVSTYVSSVVITIIVSLPLAIPVWEMPDTSYTWIIVLIMVSSAAARSYGDIEAYRHGEAAILAPIAYTRLVLIGFGAYYLYGEVPDSATLAGGTIIIAATLYIAQREARRRRRS